MGNSHAAYGPSRTDNGDSRGDGLLRSHAFQDGVSAEPAGQVPYTFDCVVAALAHHVSRAKLLSECDPVWMSAHNNDLLRAEPFGGNYPAEAHRTVADDRDL